MSLSPTRRLLAASSAGALLLLGGGTAYAVSSGGYHPAEQDCSKRADANDRTVPEEGCHNAKVNVEDREGNRYAEAGTDQTAPGTWVHRGDARVDTNGDGSGAGAAVAGDADDPTATSITPSSGTPDTSVAGLLTGTRLSFGADDNLDRGEHDGANGRHGSDDSENGPSDGGALVVGWHPLAVTGWSPDQARTNPVPVADAGAGGCADGICVSAQTRRRVAYQGGGDGERSAADYEGKRFDPAGCDSGSDAGETRCHGDDSGDPQTMDQWRAQEGTVYADPGVQVYEDPDPQGSPLGGQSVYPLPAAYAGTCGVIAGGGVVQAPDSPVTNGAGQVDLDTGC